MKSSKNLNMTSGERPFASWDEQVKLPSRLVVDETAERRGNPATKSFEYEGNSRHCE